MMASKALLWLADNVSDEMVMTAIREMQDKRLSAVGQFTWVHNALSVALRQAAGGGDE